jgi:hypothetical protein
VSIAEAAETRGAVQRLLQPASAMQALQQVQRQQQQQQQ